MKYKLLKDFLDVKAGEIFELKDDKLVWNQVSLPAEYGDNREWFAVYYGDIRFLFSAMENDNSIIVVDEIGEVQLKFLVDKIHPASSLVLYINEILCSIRKDYAMRGFEAAAGIYSLTPWSGNKGGFESWWEQQNAGRQVILKNKSL